MKKGKKIDWAKEKAESDATRRARPWIKDEIVILKGMIENNITARHAYKKKWFSNRSVGTIQEKMRRIREDG